MYKILKKTLIIFAVLVLVSCKNDNKKPFGAETIDYEKVENINKDGPGINETHPENTPPSGDKTIFSENGPKQDEIDSAQILPTADIDESPNYGGIPIVTKENN